jgi:hypothetical protein
LQERPRARQANAAAAARDEHVFAGQLKIHGASRWVGKLAL